MQEAVNMDTKAFGVFFATYKELETSEYKNWQVEKTLHYSWLNF